MVAKGTQKTPGRPAGKRNTIARATGLIQMRLPKEDHAALMAAAKKEGKTLTSWMRGAAQETLLLAEERRFSTRLRIVEDAAERAAKGAAKTENRIENLFAQASKIEKDTIGRDGDLSIQVAALVTALEAQGSNLSVALLLLAVLLRASTPDAHRWFREATAKGIPAGRLLSAILERQD
jgi:uncharacterized protein (DUF1778 family)